MRKAFTLIELLVVIAIIAVLVTILVPVVINALGESERTVCTSNLKIIGKAYQDYAHLTPDSTFPRHITSPTMGINANGVAGIVAAGSDVLDITAGDNSMNTVWVLISKGMLAEKAFKCPGDETYVSRTIETLYGWGAQTEFSYGIHFPYALQVAAGTVNAADPNDQYDTDLEGATEPLGGVTNPIGKKGDWRYLPNWVLLADRNPGGAVDGPAGTIEHSNHQGEEGGCATVTKIGNAGFHDSETDSMAGFGDNIYTSSTEGNAGGTVSTTAAFPALRTDTVISPTVSRP